VFQGIAPTRLRLATAWQAERGGYSLRDMAHQRGPLHYFNSLLSYPTARVKVDCHFSQTIGCRLRKTSATVVHEMATVRKQKKKQTRPAKGVTTDPLIRPEEHLAKFDPRLAALIGRAGPFTVSPGKLVRPFDALAESIAYQQLSGKAAATIWKRVRTLYPRRKWLDPRLVLATPDEKFRAAGLSRSKTVAIKDLAAKTIDGTVPSARVLAGMSDEEISGRLTTVRGIGRWTVEMLLIFELGRLDVWPATDYGVQKGFAKTFGRRKLPTQKQFLKIGEKWRPYRSVAAWYFWRALDVPEVAANRFD